MHGLKRLIIFISMFAAISEAQYLLPITKNETTKQYYTTINIGSAANSPVNLLLDIGTDLSWLNCRKIKSLSSLHLVPCQSPTCKSIPSNACDGKHCLYLQQSPFVKNHTVSTVDRVVQDKATISTKVSFRPFTFSCVAQTHIQGLSPPIAGVLGLSPGEFPFWRQVTRAFNIIPRFAICLPSSGNGNFFIGGGAMLSTVVPYTVLQTDIYNALASAFTRKAMKIGMSEIPRLAPFKHCFQEGSSMRINEELMNVTSVEIKLPGNGREVKWTFHGKNTVVRVLETVICLAFVDGGEKPKESMVIETHQLQDYILNFDMSTTRLAFSDSLLLHNFSCSA
ncbi:hypothetical protein DY000_02018494 [Brassica cretica]|uniref:Xylanase inhibitor C-terminal domain-containing protein n=1 Tax=Brassica cretica TaxID=69181 RepID=A0ABQ7CUR3_BRACR|nr:hypothetical protein DY000_02018494 [Brassica cretica]